MMIITTKENNEIILSINNTEKTMEIKLINKTIGETYKITYDANGGKGKQAIQEIRKGFSSNLEECAYQKEYYSFIGWGTTKEAKEVMSVGTRYTPSEDITLYAIWSNNPATVIYNANNGKGNEYVAKAEQGKSTKLLTYNAEGYTNYKAPTDEYHFKEWNTKADGTGESYNGGGINKTSKDTIEITRDTITLYAIWEKHIYKENIPATCYSIGQEKCECGVTRELAMVEHTPGVEATCTKPQVCTVCNKELAQPTGHKYTEGICTKCGDDICFLGEEDKYRGKWSFSLLATKDTGFWYGLMPYNPSLGEGYIIGVSYTANWNGVTGDHSLGGNVGMIISNDTVDVTKMEKIVIDGWLYDNCDSADNVTTIGIAESNSSAEFNDYYSFVESSTVTSHGKNLNKYKLELDVSKLTGNYYLKVTTRHEDTAHTCCSAFNKIDRIYPVYK